MKILKHILMFIGAGVLFVSCEDQMIRESQMPYPNDVTFNKEENSIDIEVPALQFVQFDTPFTARAFHEGTITFNAKKKADGTHIGFALSNKNNRSFPFCNSTPYGSENPEPAVLKAATDTALYSCYTGATVNKLKNFAVVRVEGEEAYFTIDKPRVVEHLLISNCTFNYLALSYGDLLSSAWDATTQSYLPKTAAGADALIANPSIFNTSIKGVWRLPDYYNFTQGEQLTIMVNNTKKTNGYFKVTATGYNGNTQTGTSDFWLCVRTGVAPEPYNKWNTVLNAWGPWDLSGLGVVDKIVFTLDSSEKCADGSLKLAPYFCIDGIRLK